MGLAKKWKVCYMYGKLEEADDLGGETCELGLADVDGEAADAPRHARCRDRHDDPLAGL